MKCKTPLRTDIRWS